MRRRSACAWTVRTACATLDVDMRAGWQVVLRDSHRNSRPRAFPDPAPCPALALTSMSAARRYPALHDGKAPHRSHRRLPTICAAHTRSKAFDVDVMTAPPTWSADGAQHYINQGGAEMVTFTPGGAWTEAGVKVGDYTFRSFPLPDHPGQYFSLFAFSWQLPVDTPMCVYATQSDRRAGAIRFLAQSLSRRSSAPAPFRLEDMNIDRIVNQIDPRAQNPRRPGDALRLHQQRDAQGEQQNARRSAPADRAEVSLDRRVPAHGGFHRGSPFRRSPHLHLAGQKGGPAGASGLRSGQSRALARSPPPTTAESSGRRTWASTATAS